jgi:hypothetical protein
LDQVLDLFALFLAGPWVTRATSSPSCLLTRCVLWFVPRSVALIVARQ